MDVFLHRNWHTKGTRLLAGNGSIARSFGCGGQDHESWRSQGIGQVGGTLHLESCPVEVHVWIDKEGCGNFRRRKLFLLNEIKNNVQDPWKGSEEVRESGLET